MSARSYLLIFYMTDHSDLIMKQTVFLPAPGKGLQILITATGYRSAFTSRVWAPLGPPAPPHETRPSTGCAAQASIECMAYKLSTIKAPWSGCAPNTSSPHRQDRHLRRNSPPLCRPTHHPRSGWRGESELRKVRGSVG